MCAKPGDYKCVANHENVQLISVDELLEYKKMILKKGLKIIVTGDDNETETDWRDICNGRL